jgi:hypothetical protein
MTDQRFMKAYRSFLTAASLFTWFNLGQKVNCWEKNLIKIFTNYSIKIDRCQIYSPRSRRTFSFYSLFFCVDEVESRCCKMVGGGIYVTLHSVFVVWALSPRRCRHGYFLVWFCVKHASSYSPSVSCQDSRASLSCWVAYKKKMMILGKEESGIVTPSPFLPIRENPALE